MSTHAQAAKLIKQDLKRAFPTVKFSVKSESYSGGNSIRIYWTNGPVTEAVSDITGKYQLGHFDGMIDCYEYSNHDATIPQVMYIFNNREVSEEIKEKIFATLQKMHTEFDKVYSLDECSADLMKTWNAWTPREFIYRLLYKMDLTNGYQESSEALGA